MSVAYKKIDVDLTMLVASSSGGKLILQIVKAHL